MGRYIVVLNGNLNNNDKHWTAVRWSNSLQDFSVTPLPYTAGVNKPFIKNGNEKVIGPIEVEEIITRKLGNATILDRGGDGTNSKNLLGNKRKATKSTKMGTILISIMLVFVISSCNFSGKLTKRYKSIDVQENKKIDTFIDVNAYVMDKEKKSINKPKNIFDLSPRAQAALITELSQKENTSDKLISALRNNISSNSINIQKLVDYTQFEKTLVLSIRNKSHQPADRIAKIKITLAFPENVKILSCDRLITQYQTFDMGGLFYSNTQSGEVSGNLSLGSGNETTTTNDKTTGITTGSGEIGVNGKWSASRTFSEEVLLRQRVVALNAAIKGDTALSFYQDGISGIDLTGNIMADIIFEVKNKKVEKVYYFKNLFKGDTANVTEKITVEEKLLIIPGDNEDIKATVTFDADYRHVKNKRGKTISEADDRIIMYHGESSGTEETIVPVELIKPYLWKLTVDPVAVPIQIQKNGVGGALLFDSYDEAKSFVDWLKKSEFDHPKQGLSISKDYAIVLPPGSSGNFGNVIIKAF